MGSDAWAEAKAARAASRAVDPLVQGRRRGHAAKRQRELIVKLAADGDQAAQKELTKREGE